MFTDSSSLFVIRRNSNVKSYVISIALKTNNMDDSKFFHQPLQLLPCLHLAVQAESYGKIVSSDSDNATS